MAENVKESTTVVRIGARGRSLMIPVTRQAREIGVDVGDYVEVTIRRLDE